ncbi:MAG: hypothetical protein WAL75_26450 [Terracidiphilus sp.]
MSLIKNTDPNNQLSDRHRAEIHLLPKRQTIAAGSAHEAPVGRLAKTNDSSEKPRNISSTSERKPMAIVARRSVQQ